MNDIEMLDEKPPPLWAKIVLGTFIGLIVSSIAITIIIFVFFLCYKAILWMVTS